MLLLLLLMLLILLLLLLLLKAHDNFGAQAKGFGGVCFLARTIGFFSQTN